MSNQPQVWPAQEFDRGTLTASPDIRTRMEEIRLIALSGGLDIQQLSNQSETASREDAPGLMQSLHDSAALLFDQWKSAQLENDTLTMLAYARIFNGLTYCARALNTRYELIDATHLDQLAQNLQAGFARGPAPEDLAKAIDTAAKAHTHAHAWLWVVLPTFARQPYGRILLRKVALDGFAFPIFVTQPFFLMGQSTLFHTHGQNWAVSRPLGRGREENVHINTLWAPRSKENPFPLVQIDMVEYWNQEAVVVPPRVIHGISKKRVKIDPVPPLADVLADKKRKERLVAETRFGELACMHLYCPDPSLSESLAQSPIVRDDTRFFLENDMIVFDHFRETVWSGNGGSWPRRMVEFGTTGDHCGVCFEDDLRRENLDPALIWKWLLASPPPEALRFPINRYTDSADSHGLQPLNPRPN